MNPKYFGHLHDGHTRGEDIFARMNADVVHPKNLLSTLLHVIKDYASRLRSR